MSQSSIDPFVRIRGYRNHPKTIPEKSDERFNRPFYQQSIRVENFTNRRIACYSNFGLRTIIPPFNARITDTVRIELTLSIHQGAVLDYLAMESLMEDLSLEQIKHLHDFFEAQEATLGITRKLHLHWDIPLEELKHAPCGVLVEKLGVVVQIHNPELDATEHFVAAYRPPPVVAEEVSGLIATFNKHDTVVKGVWINIGGVKPIKLCSNQNDTNRPEGLTVVMDGETLELTLSEMAQRGFYLSAMTASAAHTTTNAEQTAVYKQFVSDQDKLIDREDKKADKDFERAEKRANQEYDRAFKEDERIEKRSDKAYDREQALIDRTSSRKMTSWHNGYTKIIGVFAVVTAGVKLAVDIKKYYDTLVDK